MIELSKIATNLQLGEHGIWFSKENAEQIINKRNLINDLYMEGLRPLAEKVYIQLLLMPKDCSCNGHIFYIIIQSFEKRTYLIKFLKEHGISAVFHYVPHHSSPTGRKYGKASGTLEVTDRVSDCLLRLPLYYEMTPENVQYVVDRITHFYRDSVVNDPALKGGAFGNKEEDCIPLTPAPHSSPP